MHYLRVSATLEFIKAVSHKKKLLPSKKNHTLNQRCLLRWGVIMNGKWYACVNLQNFIVQLSGVKIASSGIVENIISSCAVFIVSKHT